MRISIYPCMSHYNTLLEIDNNIPSEFQVDLEPQGKIHVIVELKWQGNRTKVKFFFKLSNSKVTNFFDFRTKCFAKQWSCTKCCARSRIQRTSWIQSTSWCYATSCSPGFYLFSAFLTDSATERYIYVFIQGERTQIHGNIFTSTNILFTLQGVYLVSNIHLDMKGDFSLAIWGIFCVFYMLTITWRY